MFGLKPLVEDWPAQHVRAPRLLSGLPGDSPGCVVTQELSLPTSVSAFLHSHPRDKAMSQTHLFLSSMKKLVHYFLKHF